jgi:hypothetical protein
MNNPFLQAIRDSLTTPQDRRAATGEAVKFGATIALLLVLVVLLLWLGA